MIILFILLFFIISPPLTKASLEFKTSHIVTYETRVTGDTIVTQKISLTNNFSNIYPQEYQLVTNNIDVKNLLVKSDSGEVTSELSKNNDQATIKLKFNKAVVGREKVLTFIVSYTTSQIAKKRGQIWEVNIPDLGNIQDLDSVLLVIKTPVSFGNLAYASIPPKNKVLEDNTQVISYQKQQLENKHLSLAFGSFQTLDFSLEFFLTNKENEIVIKEISIPPDTSYQTVLLTTIDPIPLKVDLDQDYNWLAKYEVNPGEIKKILVSGQVKIFSRPENQLFTAATAKGNKNWPDYLKEDKFWEVNDQQIRLIAQENNTPEKIYNFVVQNLEYDLQNLKNVQREGASTSLKRKIGVCTEFSDLFVTLSRAAGFPARELEGFVFTNNQEALPFAKDIDILHSWAEYWDSKKEIWTPVDPTWEKTTGGMDFLRNFDLGHFVFSIHGKNSVYPLPPGNYKTDQSQKNIDVRFSDKLLAPPSEKFQASLQETTEKKLSVVIKNQSLASAYILKAIMQDWQGKKKEVKIIEFLPPLGEISININRPNLITRIFGKPTYHLEINGVPFSLEFPRLELSFKKIFANLFSIQK